MHAMQHVVDELCSRRVSRSRHGAPITCARHACQCCVCLGGRCFASPCHCDVRHQLDASVAPTFCCTSCRSPSSDFEDFNWISAVWQAAIKSKKLPLKQIIKIGSKAAVRSLVGPKTFVLFCFCIMTEVFHQPLALCLLAFFLQEAVQVVCGGKLEGRKAGEGAGASLASLPLTHLLLLLTAAYAYALHGCSNKLHSCVSKRIRFGIIELSTPHAATCREGESRHRALPQKK